MTLETAAITDGVGAIEETLKLGESAYTTPEAKTGSTIRAGWQPSTPDQHDMTYRGGSDLPPQRKR